MATGSEREAAPAGPLYVDASALVKLYLPEPESDDLNRALSGRRDLVGSDMAVTEIVSSLARRRRKGEIDVAAVARLHRACWGTSKTGSTAVSNCCRRPIARPRGSCSP